MKAYNTDCIRQTAATIEALLGMGQTAPRGGMSAPLSAVLEAAKAAFAASSGAGPASQKSGGPCADRLFFYNPDAIAQWIFEKYRGHFGPLFNLNPLFIPMLSVFPPVTPVCFASMYSGLEPAVHGIQSYVKPVLQVPTVFDDLPAAGRKAAIVSTSGDSISMIFLNRPVDYFIYKTKEECSRKALELIAADSYDLIVLYNGDYDHYMHRVSPVGRRAIRALDEDIETFAALHSAILQSWKKHNSVLAFAPDHGCHEIACRLLGSHGIDDPCDMNTVHFYTFLPRS